MYAGGERQAQGAEREPRRRAPAAHAAVARLDRAERAEQQPRLVPELLRIL